MARLIPLTPLCELIDGQEADAFVLLSAKNEAMTRDGKPSRPCQAPYAEI